MFWRRRGRGNTEASPTVPTPPANDAEMHQGEETTTVPDEPGPIVLERDAPRPVAIQHAAEELSRRGDRVIELFKEVRSSQGRANLAIHLKRGSEPEEDVFVEVATGPWDDDAIRNAATTAAVLRGSDHADATLEFLSAYPVPDEVRFFGGRSAVALLGLNLVHGDLHDPEAYAEAFREAANRHWDLNLNYETDNLPQLEELLTTALSEEADGTPPFVLNPLVRGLGCYVGETLRRHSPQSASWSRAEEWGEWVVLEFPDLAADPIGQARSFMENGPEDSVAFYADYVLKELGDRGR